MLLFEFLGLFPDKRWLPALEFLFVGHSQLVLFLFLCKIPLLLHPSFPAPTRGNADNLEWSDPQTSCDTNNIAFPGLFFLFSSIALHPTYPP